MQNLMNIQALKEARRRYLRTDNCDHNPDFRRIAKVGDIRILQCGVCAKEFSRWWN